MKRRLLRLLVAIVVLVLGGLAAWTLLVPRLVHSRLLSALGDVDPVIEARLGRARGGHVRLEGLSIGREPWLAADAVDVEYTPAQILAGRVGRVSIEGLAWRIAPGERGSDPAARAPGAGAVTTPGPGPLDPPFARVDAPGAVVTILTPDQVLSLPLDVRLVRTGRRQLEFGIELVQPVSLARPPLRGTIGGLSAHGWLVTDGKDGMALLDAKIELEKSSARHDSIGLALEAVTASVPASTGPPPIALGKVAVGRISWRDRPLGSLRGRAALGDGGLVVLSVIEVAGGLEIALRGSLTWADGAVTGEIRADLEPSPVRDPAALARLAGLEPGAEIAGRIGMKAGLALDGAGLRADLAAALVGLSLTLPARELSLEGVDLAARTAGPWPRTPPAQTLAVAAGRLGRIGFRDLAVEFSIAEGPTVRVERATWRLDDGASIAVTPFEFDPADPVLDTTLVVEDLTLDHWLPLASGGRATGEGRLSGRIPVTVRPGERALLQLGEGHLAAAPAAGRIRIGDAAQFGELLDRSDRRFQTDDTMRLVRDRIVEAFADFRYDRLRLDLERGAEEFVLRAFTSGRGGRGEHPQEIGGLTINLYDVDAVVSDLVSLRSAVNRSADRALERFFDD